MKSPLKSDRKSSHLLSPTPNKNVSGSKSNTQSNKKPSNLNNSYNINVSSSNV